MKFKTSRTQYVEPVMVLELCAVLKDSRAFQLWLQRADKERSAFFVYLPLFKDFFGFGPPYAELLAHTARK
jgi:hypothetical protein